MPQAPNKLLRLLVPLGLAVVAVIAAIAVGINATRGPSKLDPGATPAAAPAAEARPAATDPSPTLTSLPGSPQDAAPSQVPTQAQTQAPNQGPNQGPNQAAAPASPVAPLSTGLRFRIAADPGAAAPLGALDGSGGYEAQVEFAAKGAGVLALRLDRYVQTVGGTDHVELQRTQGVDTNSDGVIDISAVPFAMLSVVVNDVELGAAGLGVWRALPDHPGAFEAIIEDAAGNEVLRLTRTFELEPGSFRVTVRQRVENRSAAEALVRLVQTGPIDMPKPTSKYGGDKRRIRFGYLFSEPRQAGSTVVTADSELRGRNVVLGDRSADSRGFKRYAATRAVWPEGAASKDNHRLVWFAVTDRYFGVATHPVVDPAAQVPGAANKLLSAVETVDRLVLDPYVAKPDDAIVVTRMTSPSLRVAPGGAVSADFGVYAGPLLDEVFDADPMARALNLHGLIAYNFGGFCGETCTFGWLTHLLLFVLRLFHGLTGDWGLGIILLVVAVRGTLHPITRWSQIRLQRFGAQMQAIGPKMQKLRERYKDDPKRQQQETARLFREEHVNPAGALGCLPMFLQSPVWIALYATLYFAAEMRHQPAFYGLFQAISGGQWRFLADLASPDAALPLPGFLQFTPPFLGSVYGKVTSINLLPLLLGVVFYVHQKYLTPPTTATLTPDQEQMQKTMKFVSVVMFPLFMYTAPSGLALYFITNSTLAIFESKWIRAHANKHGLLDPEKIKAEKARKAAAAQAGGKPVGIGGWVQQRIAMAQQLAEQQQAMRAQQASGGAPRRKVSNTAPADRYKRRDK